MDDERQAFFYNHPDPMWVFDMETLRFLDVNNAAVRHYGYTQQEFLAMTLADIRPPEDVPALRAIVATRPPGLGDPQFVRHRVKSGQIISVQLSDHELQFHGRRARLICARDVTRLVDLERERTEALEREARARQASERIAQRFQSLFAAVPGRFLVLAPDGFEVLAVSDAYLQATHTSRDKLVGHNLFATMTVEQVRQAPEAELGLRQSLERVLATRLPDRMDVQAFPVPNADEGLELRYWCVVNAPVLDAGGQIAYIFHKVEDVTDLVRQGGIDAKDIPALLDAPGAFELALRTRELKDRTLQLEAQVAELRKAQELLAMATWTLDLDTGHIAVSENFHRLLALAPEQFVPTLEGYLSLVHPEDRAAMRESLAAFGNAGASHYHIRQRMVRPFDGSTMHLLVVGEFHPATTGRVLTCIAQDVTAQVEATQELNKLTTLARIATRAARLGGWRYEVATARLTWEAQTYAIYGLAPGSEPDLEVAMDQYAPEYRERIREVFTRCVEAGEPFDELMQFIGTGQRRIWVRVIGEAERDEGGRVVAVQGAFQDVDEMVRVQQEAQQLSRTLAATLESISDAFFTLDQQWRFTYLNSQAELLLSHNRDDLMGRNIWEVFPEAVGTVFQTEYERVMQTGGTARFDQPYQPLGLRIRVAAYRVPEGIAVYFSDITREYEQESQLRLLQAAAERMSDVLIITEAEPIDGPDGPRIVYVNEAFVQRTGYSREEVIGRTPRILQGPKTQQDQLKRIRHSLERWQPVRAEIINYTRSGEEIWLELNIAPLADASGWYTHWVSVERDVTERRRADELARVNDERFRLIARATNDVVWDWDVVGGVVWWNEGMRTLFGYPAEKLEAGPESWTNRVHPDDLKGVMKSIDSVIRGTASTWSGEYRFMHADGRALTVIDRGFVIRNEAGVAVRMLGSMVDISERLALDAQLRQSQKLEAVGHLTGGVAHDFNNLLTVILGNATQLNEALAADPQLQSLAAMTETAAQRGAELINRMLAFSRRQALDPKVLDINGLLGGMEGLFRRTLPEDIELEFVPGADLWASEVDPGQLELALLNLVVNARDAMPEGGKLTIQTANAQLDDAFVRQNPEVLPGQYVMVCVADTGTGMSAQVLQRVFDPFFTTKEVGKGSGLGLSMVYGFVTQSRGHVSLQSEEGQGTVAKLYFPRALAAMEPAPVPRVSAPAAGGHEHILIVEDDDLVREHVVAQLLGLGYKVTHASSGQQALDLLPGMNDLALLFTDVVMPGGMSGRDLAREVRAQRPGIKVLFTSGYSEDAIVHNGRLDPGVHLLSKPYRRKALAEKVRQVLDSTD
jgi:PAS domain S-box-containing protein